MLTQKGDSLSRKPGKQDMSQAAVEILSLSKWRGAVAQLDRRFVKNEPLQSLIELAVVIRHVQDHRRGFVRDKPLEPLLRKVSVTIDRGSIVGIIDIGGQSRDTLIRILSNSEAPSTGVVRFYGKLAAFRQLGASDRDYLTCRKNIELGARLVGMPLHDIRGAMDRLLKIPGTAEYLATPLRRLERWIFVDLGVSFLCCLDYDILVADEINRPRSEWANAAWQDYLTHAPDRNQTVIATSANIKQLQANCTHLLLINDAELYAYGPVHDIEEQHADFIAKACAAPRSSAPGSDILDEDVYGDVEVM